MRPDWDVALINGAMNKNQKLHRIMVQLEPNSTECICSDLTHEDYSPIYAWFNWLLIIVCLPSLSVFGVFTNIVNVYIYSRKRMRSSANTYLLFLSCSDFLVILTGLFIFWIDSARSYIQELSRAPYTTVYTLPFGYMAQSCSIYFTVAAAMDCYVNVCWRMLAHKYCTVRRARQILCTIIICSIVYNSLRFPQFNLRKCFHEGSQETVIEICPTTLFFTINTIYNVYMYMALMTLLPFLFLLILNAFIIVKQSLSEGPQNARETMSSSTLFDNTDGGSACERANFAASEANGAADVQVSADDTITMVAVVLLFLCCNTMAIAVNIIETFFDPDPLLLNMLSDTSNFLVIFNSSVNCVIYLIFNKEYREVFKEKFREIRATICHCRRLSRPGSDQQLFYKLPVHRSPDDFSSSGQFTQAVTIAIQPVANGSGKDANAAKDGRRSPVWQRLRLHKDPSGEDCWLGNSIAETAIGSEGGEFLLSMDDADEGDSGWDDEHSQGTTTPLTSLFRVPRSGTAHTPYQTRFLAEVKMEHRSPGQPHIYVKPISRYGSTNMSVTAL